MSHDTKRQEGRKRPVTEEPWFRPTRLRLAEMLHNQVDFSHNQLESVNMFYTEILPHLVKNVDRVWSVERMRVEQKETTGLAAAAAAATTAVAVGKKSLPVKKWTIECRTNVMKARHPRYGAPVFTSNAVDAKPTEYLTPQMARTRSMTYHAPVYVNLLHTTHVTLAKHWPTALIGSPSEEAIAASSGTAEFPGPVWARMISPDASVKEQTEFAASELFATIRAWEREFGRLVDVELTMNVEAFKVPVMVGSVVCTEIAPFSPVGNELRGFFCMLGGWRVISPISRRAHNEKFLSFRNDEKCAAEIEIRAESKPFHSTSNLRLQLSHRKTANPLLCSQIFVFLPFMVKKFYLAHVFLALGWELQDIHPAIRKAATTGKWHPDFDAQIQSMLVACRLQTQEQALLFIAHHSNRQQQIDLRQQLAAAQATVDELKNKHGSASAVAGAAATVGILPGGTKGRGKNQTSAFMMMRMMSGKTSAHPQPYLSTGALSSQTRQLAVPIMDYSSSSFLSSSSSSSSSSSWQEEEGEVDHRETGAEIGGGGDEEEEEEEEEKSVGGGVGDRRETKREKKSESPKIKKHQTKDDLLHFARGVINKTLLPQIGTTDASNFVKGWVLARMVYELLAGARRPRMIHAFEAESDVGYTRYYGVGLLLGNLLRQILGYDQRDRKKQMARLYEKQADLDPSDRRRITAREIFQDRYITRRLDLSIATARWTAAIGSYIRMGVARSPNPNSRASWLSDLSRVTSPYNSKGKHISVRSVSSSQYGKLDPYDTPDGRSCGLVGNCPPHTVFSLGTPPERIIQLILREYKGILPITKENWRTRFFSSPGVATADSYAANPWEVVVEGRPVGWVEDKQHFVEWFQQERDDKGKIDRQASIHPVAQFRDVSIRCDAGRPLSLLLNFRKLHLLRTVDWLATNKETLIEQGILVYRDALEIRDHVTAFDELDVRERLMATPGVRFDFMEVDPSFSLSFSSSLNPKLEHNPAARVCFQDGMNKHLVSFDPEQHHLQKSQCKSARSQRPYMHTMSGRIDGGMFQLGLRVAHIALFSTDTNPEDAFDVSGRLVDLMGVSSSVSHVHRSSVRRVGTSTNKVTFEPLTAESCFGFKDADHSKVGPLGIPSVGTLIPDRTIVISRSVHIVPPLTNKEIKSILRFKKIREMNRGPHSSAATHGSSSSSSSSTKPITKLEDLDDAVIDAALGIPTRRDDSDEYRGRTAIVTASIATTNQAGLPLCKVELTHDRDLAEGDKISSRHGQKCVCGSCREVEDMIHTAEGYPFDALLAPACLPSRMTVGQQFEMLISKAIMLGGKRAWGDATPFRGPSSTVEEISDFLISQGFMGTGEDTVYHPETGEPMRVQVFNGPLGILLQKHFAVDKEHARGESGRVDAITGQPVEGRKRGGGQRVGGMEYTGITSHAATYNLEGIIRRSGTWRALICRACGSLAYIDYRTGRFCCKCCGTGEHVYRVLSQPAFRIAIYETMALGIRMSFRLTDRDRLHSRTARRSRRLSHHSRHRARYSSTTGSFKRRRM